MTKYILSDESLNSFGFRVLTSGLDIESRYLKNPIILYDHNGYILSVGKMKVYVEGDKLIGEPEWDIEDGMGAELSRKYEKGYMSAFSISFEPIQLSDEPSMLLPGQKRMTVVKSELVEVSATNIPSNKNAVKLSANSEIKEIPLIILNSNEMKKISLAFGMPEDATEDQILEKLNAQKSENETLKNQNVDLSKKVSELSEKIESTKKEKLETLLSNSKKRFSEEQKETFRKLAEVDYDNAVKLIGLSKDLPDLKDVTGSKLPEQNDGKTFKQLQKENPAYLAKLKAENPEEFQRLLKEDYK